MDVQQIELDRITTKGVETRAGLKGGAIIDYAQAIERGEELPPSVVYSDGGRLYLACGHHRLAAHRRAGRSSMPCEVRQGGRWAAVKAGIQDNQQHKGERLTSADKRHNARLILGSRPELSDGAIATLCGTSPRTVGRIRAELESTAALPELKTRIGADGRVRDTSAIGRKPATDKPVSPDPQTPALEPETPSEDPRDDCPPELPVETQGEAPEVVDVDNTREGGGDEDRCTCNEYWTSDGMGGRFCDGCGNVHPDTPSEPYQAEADSQPSAAEKPTAAPPRADVMFREAARLLGGLKRHVDGMGKAFPGPHYRNALVHLDRAGGVFENWKREEGG